MPIGSVLPESPQRQPPAVAKATLIVATSIVFCIIYALLTRLLVTRTQQWRVTTLGHFLYEFRDAGAGGPEAIAKAQTMAVTTVIMFQIFYLLNCRSLRDSVWKIGLFSTTNAVASSRGGMNTQRLIFMPSTN